MTDTTAINQAYFNKVAAEYDEKFADIIKPVEDNLRSSGEFLGLPEGGRFLDYACGTGLLSRILGPQLSQCVGLDVSENMVGAYNARARTEGYAAEARTAHLGNLVDPADPAPAALAGPEFADFDAVGISTALHHLDDCDLAAQRLVERLRPGGVLVVVDFMTHTHHHNHHHSHNHNHNHNHHEHGDLASHGVKHAGFAEDQIRAIFEKAGAGTDFRFKKLDKELVFKGNDGVERRRTVFFARGTKA